MTVDLRPVAAADLEAIHQANRRVEQHDSIPIARTPPARIGSMNASVFALCTDRCCTSSNSESQLATPG